MAGYTLLRQEEDIRQSRVYSDAIAPTEAAFETNPVDLETDLNNIRSQLHNLLKNQAGNWWDDLNTPTALDTGTQRGVNDLNTDLHALERKRVLRCVWTLADVPVPAAAAATGVLTGTANFSDTETVVIGSKTYTFQTTLTNVDGNVQIGGSLTASLQNLRDAIDLTGTPGTQYAASMTQHPTVSGTANDATTLTVAADTNGTAGNAIATTETAANASWGAATLTGGAGDVAVLAAADLPGNTTAAVGAVTTNGTVVAFHTGTFGQHSLDELAGATAISPKTLYSIVDGSTKDPILDSSQRRIYALAQSEIATDGHTLNDTTQRLQLSFVVVNATGDDLEAAAADDIGGATIDYCYIERVALESLTEQDFLGGANVDVPSGVGATRQVGYDSQGITPVDLTTNATLDLEGAGLYWEIRDDLQATLFKILEGSAGGTSEIQFGLDVDTFNNDAIDNDFANGATFGTSGTGIQVSETQGVIERAADLIVRASGAGELYFDDSNQPGSWAQTNGIKLSDTATEWSDFETNFGGEVSLLNAINQAYLNAQDPVRTWHEVNVATVTADNDVSGPSGANNVDVDFPDLSAGSFLTNHWLFLNGRLMRPGANAAANYDYYPGTALTPDADLRFERTLRSGDVISVIVWPNL